MNEQKLFQQKRQAQLDEWKAEVELLKAKAMHTSADIQLEISRKIRALEISLGEGKNKLVEFSKQGEATLGNFKEGIESTWDKMNLALHDVKKIFTKT